MEVILAKSRGFCFGVKRAVDTVYGQIGKTGKLYTYGDIVNNEEVVGDLKMKGVSVINDMEELKQAEKGTVIIRAHGVGKAVYEAIEKEGFTLMDATCPFVKRIHKIVEEESKKERRSWSSETRRIPRSSALPAGATARQSSSKP